MLETVLQTATVWVVPILLAVTLHEAAHGWAAWKLGDDTAKNLGRVTFNPFRHIDLFGTVLLPAMMLIFSGGKILFGFAKPVPVAFHRLRRPRRDMVLVAFAGPGTNLLLAVASAALLHPIAAADASTFANWLARVAAASVWINSLLFVFNMMPLPPLDGGRVAVGILPRPLAMRLAVLERWGIFIILGILFILPMLGDLLGVDLHVFGWLIAYPASLVAWGVFALVGLPPDYMVGFMFAVMSGG